MKTKQTGSRQPPGPEEDTLALIVVCPECKTQRAFRVSDVFMTVITRQSSGARYSTMCGKCGRQIEVQLCWTKRHLGWVSERLLFEDAVTVEDELGMNAQKGGKTI